MLTCGKKKSAGYALFEFLPTMWGGGTKKYSNSREVWVVNPRLFFC